MPQTAITEHDISIPASDVLLHGDLTVPDGAQGIVLFVHGSGSSRFSPRNRFVAKHLNTAGIATLLFDLLTDREESVDLVTAELRFDIDLLSRRLSAVTDWTGANDTTQTLPIGYFGASTGAAAALKSAAGHPDIKAIVSRGGRPDLAEPALNLVTAPVLLIVGGEDFVVIDLNRKALRSLTSESKHLEIVPGATHLFEEPGALEEVARLAADWFTRYLR